MQSAGMSPLDLTQRETEVLRLIADGHSTKRIAHELNIGIQNSRHPPHQPHKKLGIHSIAGLVRYAIRTGIIEATVLVSMAVYGC